MGKDAFGMMIETTRAKLGHTHASGKSSASGHLLGAYVLDLLSAAARIWNARTQRMRLEVSWANPDDDLRDLFKQYGEQVVAKALALAPIKVPAFQRTQLRPRAPWVSFMPIRMGVQSG
jgi:hypothetical protein